LKEEWGFLLIGKGGKMANERVIMILKSRGSPFSEKELKEMSEKDGYAEG
jgi:hypothetical protein